MTQTLPEELRQLLLQIDDCERGAEAIVAGMSDESVNAKRLQALAGALRSVCITWR